MVRTPTGARGGGEETAHRLHRSLQCTVHTHRALSRAQGGSWGEAEGRSLGDWTGCARQDGWGDGASALGGRSPCKAENRGSTAASQILTSWSESHFTEKSASTRQMQRWSLSVGALGTSDRAPQDTEHRGPWNGVNNTLLLGPQKHLHSLPCPLEGSTHLTGGPLG